MLKGFKDFLLRGNVIDLAVAVVMGAAFGGIVTAFTVPDEGQPIARRDHFGYVRNSPDRRAVLRRLGGAGLDLRKEPGELSLAKAWT